MKAVVMAETMASTLVMMVTESMEMVALRPAKLNKTTTAEVDMIQMEKTLVSIFQLSLSQSLLTKLTISC